MPAAAKPSSAAFAFRRSASGLCSSIIPRYHGAKGQRGEKVVASEPAASASGLVKKFGDRRVVDGVDLVVPRGMIYGVLGPNGAGKTTTLRMMLGIIEPDAGDRRLLGRDRPREASDQVGYLPEERGLYPAMKAKEAIAFMGALRGLDWKTGRARAIALLEDVGMGHAADEKIRKLSKGMAQLVQLLGSIVHQPDLLVLDEPFSGLDPVNQEKLEKLILAERDRGATVIFSTHIMAHAERLCDRLAIIAGGKRRFEGTVAEARGTLPFKAHYVPHHPAPGIAALLPGDAVEAADGWRFTVPEEGIENVLTKLIAAGYGISGLSIERPSLHDAFVRIVGPEALAEAAA
ncbi:ATP-binding cassette domain-containing protein [Sphingomonas koreensis]|nr:ATP-binding cassette domain-containing protein [Sphingomonas koreensis]